MCNSGHLVEGGQWNVGVLNTKVCVVYLFRIL